MKVLLLLGLLSFALAAPQPGKKEQDAKLSNTAKAPAFKPTQHGLTSRTQANTNESWAYVEVRPNAHMFYWLYRTYHQDGYTNRPLILWLQGGPGGSGVGYGNFEEIGPFDVQLNPRNATWLKQANLIFVDNPVGAGYSYCANEVPCWTTDVDQISNDLITLFQVFFNTFPEFSNVPFYTFGQSYGGKMAAAFMHKLQLTKDVGDINVNIAGFAMGNAWIHPLDSTLSWAPFLYANSLVDEQCNDSIMAQANNAKAEADAGRWRESTNQWRATQLVVNECTNYVDFYNIMKFRVISSKGTKLISDIGFENMVEPLQTMTLDELMNGPVREYLGIIPPNVRWGGQRRQVFSYQEGDFMKDVVGILNSILTNMNMRAIVYQGQLDLICDNIGAMDFVRRIQWPGRDGYMNGERKAFEDPETRQTESFVKANQAFKYYWILRGGHSIPKDQPWATYRVLERILADSDV